MIAYVNDILESIEEGLAIVDVGGIGMNVFISGSTMDRMPGIGEAVKLYTYTSVKEDSFTLYGFLSRDELSLFKMLISVNGIGPKGGLSILSVMTPDDLRFAIMAGDAGTISKAPGVGKKTAERITLELRDKIKAIEEINRRWQCNFSETRFTVRSNSRSDGTFGTWAECVSSIRTCCR